MAFDIDKTLPRFKCNDFSFSLRLLHKQRNERGQALLQPTFQRLGVYQIITFQLVSQFIMLAILLFTEPFMIKFDFTISVT